MMNPVSFPCYTQFSNAFHAAQNNGATFKIVDDEGTATPVTTPYGASQYIKSLEMCYLTVTFLNGKIGVLTFNTDFDYQVKRNFATVTDYTCSDDLLEFFNDYIEACEAYDPC